MVLESINHNAAASNKFIHIINLANVQDVRVGRGNDTDVRI
jgi:hypothetical protein